MNNTFITPTQILTADTFNAIANDFVYHRRSTPLSMCVISINTQMKIRRDIQCLLNDIDAETRLELYKRLNDDLYDLDSVDVYDAHDTIVAFEKMISELKSK